MTVAKSAAGSVELYRLCDEMKSAYPDANLYVLKTSDQWWLMGTSRLPEYRAWSAARARCTQPRNPAYGAYGGRGIGMAAEWENDFLAFWRELGPRPAGMSLDRVDNDRGYEPGNVRWATDEQQANNKRGPQSRHERLAEELRAAGWTVVSPDPESEIKP